MRVPSFAGWRFAGIAVLGHLRRRWLLYAAMACVALVLHAHFRIGVNVSPSLPYRLFLVALDQRPTKVGDLVSFEWQRSTFYEPHAWFTKRVAAVGGQRITVKDRKVFVDGEFVAYAKTHSKRGVPLEPISEGVIPAGALFVLTPHEDSLDSRYSVTGLVEPARVIGRAHVLF